MVTQEDVLAVLAQQDGMMSADDLAKEMNLTGDRVSSFLSKLKNKEQWRSAAKVLKDVLK